MALETHVAGCKTRRLELSTLLCKYHGGIDMKLPSNLQSYFYSIPLLTEEAGMWSLTAPLPLPLLMIQVSLDGI